jgi:hypothetical protein
MLLKVTQTMSRLSCIRQALERVAEAHILYRKPTRDDTRVQYIAIAVEAYEQNANVRRNMRLSAVCW